MPTEPTRSPAALYPTGIQPTQRGQWPTCHHHPNVPLDYGPHAAPLSDARYWRCPSCAGAGEYTVQPFELTGKGDNAKARPITAQGRRRPAVLPTRRSA